MFQERLKWALKLLQSRTFVVLLDKSSVVNIPLANINSFENQLLLAAQTAALQEFRSRLEDLIREHEEAISLLAHRQSVHTEAKAKTRNNRKTGTKARNANKRNGSK